ncbi:MAG TPA: hypothetical protein VGK19_09475 [Capsulimonadaceae bacterium]
MGLTIAVGILDMLDDDEEMVESFVAEFDAISELLPQPNSFEEHSLGDESADASYECDLVGYGALHKLRRIAAHIDETGEVPPPMSNAQSDPLLERYYANKGQKIPDLGEPYDPAQGFQHLIWHSDAEGYYVPVDFAVVIVAPDALQITGTLIGSSQRLLDACERLATVLGIPPGLTADDPDVWHAVENWSADATGWRRYPVETHTCCALREAAKASVGTGCAIVFG